MLSMKELNGKDQLTLQRGLNKFDYLNTKTNISKKISYGYFDNEKLVAGIIGKIEGFNIMYIETLFVDEQNRNHGYGKLLINLMEERAKFEGASIIRLDTFSWQGRDFYLRLNYEIISSYELYPGYNEYFFIKRI